MKKFIVDKKGQWAHPGKNTFIPNVNGRITMQGVGYPVLGIDDEGNSTLMQPGGEYQFPGDGVYEIPLTEDEAMAYAANGYIVEELPKAQDAGQVNGIKSLMEFQKDIKNPKTIESGRKLVYGEPGFKEQQESINKDRATIITDLVPKIPTSIQELETLVDESIGSPQKKARVLAAKRTEEGEDEQDNYRHASAGRLTAEAIQNKTGNIPYLSAGAGWLGSNILGIGHELSTFFSDDRPWLIKATEAAEDIYNNNAGASTILNSLSPKENDDILFHKSINYILPDGYGEKRPFKDNQGWTDPYNNKEEDGGIIELTDEEANNYRAGGYVLEELPIAQEGTAGKPWYKKLYEKSNDLKKQKLELKKQQLENKKNNILNQLYLRQAFAESSFDPNAVSPVGAQGLTQFMPRTIIDLKQNKLVSDDFNPLDPKQAVDAQRKYMQWLSERPYLNKGKFSVKQAKFLGAYNYGAGYIKDALTKAKKDGVDIYESLDWVSEKYLPKETADYINKIYGKNDNFNKEFKKAIKNKSNKSILDLYDDGGSTASSDNAVYSTILEGIGAPVTDENLKFLKAWRQAEGGKAANNPFNTTYKLDVDENKTDYNSVGVKNYSTAEHGIAATIKTLKLPYYKNIVSDLQNDAGASNIASNTDELKTWGTGAGVARVLNKGKVNPPSIENDYTKNVYSTDSEPTSKVALVPEVVEEPVKEKRSFRDLLDLIEEDDVVAQEEEQVSPQPIGIQAVEDPFPIYSQAMEAMGTPLYADVNQRILASQQYMKDGGFILDLDETEALEYAKNGYIVEMQPGGWPNSGISFGSSKSVPKIDIVGDALKETERLKTVSPKPTSQVSAEQNPLAKNIFERSLKKQNVTSYPGPIDPNKVGQDFNFSVVKPVDLESTDTAPEYTSPIGSQPKKLLGKDDMIKLAQDEALANSTYNKIDNTAKYIENLNKYESKEKSKAKEELINSYKNASKDEVIALQKELQEKGFNIGSSGADGIFGKNTRKALQQKLDNETLDLSSVDKYYNKYKVDKSPETTQQVIDIQNKLVDQGFLKASQVDGKFGPITKAAFEKSKQSKDPNAIFFTNIPTKLKVEQCAKGMCQILEQNDILTEALGVKYRNAWDIKENMDKKQNSTEVYNIYDNPAFKNVKSGSQLVQTTRAVKAKSSTTADMYKTGDIVGIFWPSSSHHGEVLNSKTHNTHVGFVSGVKDGVPQITHNVHGDVRTEPYSKLYTGWIQRPKSNVNLQGIKYNFKEQPVENIDILLGGAEVKKERKFTTSEKNNIKKTIKRVHSDAINLTDVLGSSADPKWIEAAAVGITGVETGIGIDVPRSRSDKSERTKLGYKIKDVKDEDISLGVGKTKFSQLDDFSKTYFNIKSPKDLANDDKAIDVVTYNLIKHYDTFKDYAEQFPELDLTEDDIRSMSILAHNRGTKKLLTLGRRGAKGSKNYYKGSDEDIFFKEVQKLRDISRMGSYQSDISSTDWKYLPGAEYLPSSITGKTSETYISKVKRYMNDLYGVGSLGEQNEQTSNEQSVWDDPYYKKVLSEKKEGGEFFELELDENELTMYLNGGYIVEEIK